MEILWSPWRSKYIGTFKDESKKETDKCFICEALNEEKDEENLVVHRSKRCVVMLNKYPYNNGHILIAPITHESNILEINDETELEIIKVRKLVISALDRVYKPHGYNIGSNLGRVAGAGLPGHIHYHIIPRWNGDTSFTAVISDVKVVSISLEETYKHIKKELDILGISEISLR